MRNVEELSEIIVGTLCDRNGFDNWWYDLEPEIQEEIEQEIQECVADWMSETNDVELEEDENAL